MLGVFLDIWLTFKVAIEFGMQDEQRSQNVTVPMHLTRQALSRMAQNHPILLISRFLALRKVVNEYLLQDLVLV